MTRSVLILPEQITFRGNLCHIIFSLLFAHCSYVPFIKSFIRYFPHNKCLLLVDEQYCVRGMKNKQE